MASNAVLTYRDGKLEVPEELRSELQLSEGSRLRVVYSASGKVMLDCNDPTDTASSLNEAVPDWNSLRGFLSQASRNPNDLLEEERLRESQLDVKPL